MSETGRNHHCPRQRTIALILGIAFLIGSSASFAWAKTGRAPEADAVTANVCRDYGLPGLAVAIAHENRVVYYGATGFASLEHEAIPNHQTVFRIGSLSKLITILALAKMMENGQIRPGDLLHQHVADFPKKAKPFTIGQLASHTAGIRHYKNKDFQDCKIYFTALIKAELAYPTLTHGLAIFQSDPLAFEPGTGYGYSSYGYNLLGVALEKAAGAPFLQLVEELVLDPLGMAHTHADHPYQLIAKRASFYNIVEPGQWRKARPSDNSYKWPSGSMISSAEDILKLALAFLKPGFLQQKTLDLVFSPQPMAKSGNYLVGLGWRIGKDHAGRTIYHHGGAIEGGRGYIQLYPQTGTAVVMLANAFAPIAEKEASKLADLFLEPAK